MRSVSRRNCRRPGIKNAANIVLLASVLLSMANTSVGQDSKTKHQGMPSQLVALSDAVTPREYVALMDAIRRETEKPEIRDMYAGQELGPLDWISAAKVPFGSLGLAMVVNFDHSELCGNGGCPMWVFVHGPGGYRNVIKDGGWGFSLEPSGRPVPDIAFYWSMGAGEIVVGRYHYAKGKFVSVAAKRARCTEENKNRGVCAAPFKQRWVWSIAPAEYEALRKEIGAPVAGTGGEQLFDDAHAVDIPLVGEEFARVVGLGNCSHATNCTISIYGGCEGTYTNRGGEGDHLPDCQYWPMLKGVSGWGVANDRDFDSDPASHRVGFVIARRRSADEVELIRYSAATRPDGLEPGTKLVRGSCEVVTSKSRTRPTCD